MHEFIRLFPPFTPFTFPVQKIPPFLKKLTPVGIYPWKNRKSESSREGGELSKKRKALIKLTGLEKAEGIDKADGTQQKRKALIRLTGL